MDGRKIVVPLVFGYIIIRLGPRFIQGCILPPTSEPHLGKGKKPYKIKYQNEENPNRMVMVLGVGLGFRVLRVCTFAVSGVAFNRYPI